MKYLKLFENNYNMLERYKITEEEYENGLFYIADDIYDDYEFIKKVNTLNLSKVLKVLGKQDFIYVEGLFAWGLKINEYIFIFFLSNNRVRVETTCSEKNIIEKFYEDFYNLISNS